MVRDAKVHYSKFIEDDKRDIHSISLNDVEDSIKFFGILLKPFKMLENHYLGFKSITDKFIHKMLFVNFRLKSKETTSSSN